LSLSTVPASATPDLLASGIGELLQAADSTLAQLLDRCDPADPMRRDLEQVQETMQQLAALTGQLGILDRRKTVRATALDLNSVVHHIRAALQRLLGPFISLDTSLHPPGLWVAGDRGKIEQVALGLVINAREALPLGGTICVATVHRVLDETRSYRIGKLPAGSWAVLEVRDNGTGVDERTVLHLLEPSLRGMAFDSSLSLATVSAVVQGAGGHLLLDTSESGGTLLAACFPAVTPPRSRLPATGVASAVLVVDDDEWTRCSAATTLRRAGYGVLEAEHTEAALELLDDVAGSCVRVMLVDADLAFGGTRPLDSVMRRERPDIEVLVMARQSTLTGSERPPALGKPFKSDDLLRAVRDRLVR
jgi:two-component system cell cycle sensor histidine kinase/response regulator CckA